MYHPGKVVEILKKTDKEIISADEISQAVLEMWDENVLTLAINKKIEQKIKVNQIVLVDYRPDEKHTPPVPKHEIVKIIIGKKANKTWEVYKGVYYRRKQKENVNQKPPAQSYIG